jgi:alpha-tubulin suppressor-like RCC1 family protein
VEKQDIKIGSYVATIVARLLVFVAGKYQCSYLLPSITLWNRTASCVVMMWKRLVSLRKISLQGCRNLVLSKGCGLFGALAQGDSLLDSENFRRVQGIGSNDSSIQAVSAGWGHSAIVSNGNLYICGRPYDLPKLFSLNNWYKFSKTLARFVAKSSNSWVFLNTSGYFPELTAIEGACDVKAVTCSAGLTLYLTNAGRIFSFGLNRWSQCGVAVPKDGSPYVFQPFQLTMLPTCVAVDAGLQHGVALSEDGVVYTWGKYDRGQLGIGQQEQSAHLPGKVILGKDKKLKAVAISAGFSHTAAIDEEGAVHVWGKGLSGDIKETKIGE